MTYNAAQFLLSSMGLIIEQIEEDVVDDINASYIIHQEPIFDQDSKMKSGDTIRIFLNNKKPVSCPD